ncbi:CocE/NonD family hydrolase [Gordonia rubripertincta]|uniref:CocE/NonD family hydrolase n=1 Tax=Gordonia rubripertincta TaxID=36822 RepID=A0ABT4MRF7_GORRU|nr:CocE/NonD family hydrolase [Gordonia rubripertincta]MCZ4549591.1 CocE/NonD family hydrolase [Gordonia rubripertincta]
MRLSVRFVGIVAGAMSLALTAGLINPVAAVADPSGGADGKRWIAEHDTNLQYPGTHVQWDVPITMSDGTVLKANIYRPADAAGRPVDTKTPVILNMTPYTKLVSAVAEAALSNPVLGPLAIQLADLLNFSGTPIDGLADLIQALKGGGVQAFSVDSKLVRSGYTQVVVDVRGTGFSQGVWDVFRAREQQDTLEVIDWAAKQKWSDGKLGMSGISYSAINQIHAANKNPEALKAIFPVEPGGDLIRDIVAPGGALGFGFLPLWLTLVNGLKFVPDVGSMLDGTFDWKWLSSRLSDPAVFAPQLLDALTAPSIGELPPRTMNLLDESSAERTGWQDYAQNIKVPTMIYGGWHDLFTNSEWRMFDNIPLPGGKKQLIMGPTYHINPGTRFGEPGYPPRLDVLQQAWFDKWLKGIDNGIENYGPATLYQQGNGWITAPDFPQPGMENQRLYLSDRASGTAPHAVRDGSLSATPSASRGRMTIAPGLTTLCSRDAAQQTAGIVGVFSFCADDARIAETNALTFTTPPVTEATTVSGPVNLHLNTVMDATDGYWTATLNDVAPDGTSTVLTSGQLMASLRALDQEKTGYSPNGDVIDPVNSLTLETRQPVVPGQPVQLDVGLLATDALIKPGHRLRIDVFAMNFPKGLPLRPLLNESELKPEHIQLDPNAPSYINVPVSRLVP